MARYVPLGTTEIDPRAQTQQAPAGEASPISNSLRMGLNQGMTETRGQFQALAGGIGEAVGADEFAKNRYAAAAAAQEKAEGQAPAINDYHQIDGVGTGVRYLAGQMGRMGPMLGMGLAGAAAAPVSLPMGAMIGGTLAVAPSMAGASIQRQQANPEALEHSAGERLAIAAGEGLTDSALSMAIPAFMGGKLLGTAARTGESAVAKAASKKMLLAKNMAEGVGGNAVAGYASEALHQNTDSYFDPNRDTSQDSQRRFDAAATGAIIGAPFGAVGFAGDVRNRPRAPGVESGPGLISRAVDGAKEKINGLRSKVEGVPLTDMAEGAVGTAGDYAAQGAEFMKRSAIEVGAKTKAWTTELLNNENTPDSVRESVQNAASTISDKASQAYIATTKFSMDAFAAAKNFDSDTARQTLTDVWGHATEVVEGKTGIDIPSSIASMKSMLDVGIEKAKNTDYASTLATLRGAIDDTMAAASEPRAAFETVRSLTRTALNDMKEADYASMMTKAKTAGNEALGRTIDAGVAGVKKVSDIFSPKAPVDLQVAKDMAAGKDGVEGINQEAFTQASPEGQKEMSVAAKTARTDQAIKMAKEMFNDKTLSPESRANLEAMQGDFTSAANSMKVGAMKVADIATKKFVATADTTYDFVKAQYDKMHKGADDGTMKSEMGEGIRAVVSEHLMPFLEQHRPEVLGNQKTMDRIAEGVRMYTTMATKGDVDMQVVRHMQSIFGGDQLRKIAMGVHEAIGGDPDSQASKLFMKEMGKLQRDEITSDSLTKTVTAALGDGPLSQHIAGNPDFLATTVNGIRAHIDESAYAGMSKERAEIEKVDFNLGMQKEFGSKAKAMLAVFAKEAENRSSNASAMSERGPGDGDHVTAKYEAGISDGEVIESSFTEGDNISDEFTDAAYMGKGFKHDMVLSKAAHAKRGLGGQSDYSKVMGTATTKYGQHKNVDFIEFKNLPKDLQDKHTAKLKKTYNEQLEKGFSKEEAIATANEQHGSPREVGMARAAGLKQEGVLSETEFQSMRVDADKTSSGGKNNPSRIDTGEGGANAPGQTLDAIRMVKVIKAGRKLDYNKSDNLSSHHRLRREFLEAITAAQIHIGRYFDVPDGTVVQNGIGGKVTWGELRKLDMDTNVKYDPSELTTFMRDASIHELRTALKPHEEVVFQHDLDVAEVAKERKIQGGKEWAALYREMETPETKEASNAVFRIESEIEGRGAEDLVNQVDASSPSLAARRAEARDLKIEEYKDGVLRRTDVAATQKQIDKNKWAVENSRPSGKYKSVEAETNGLQQDIDPWGQGHIARTAAGVYGEKAYTGEADPSIPKKQIGTTGERKLTAIERAVSNNKSLRMTDAEEGLVPRLNVDGTNMNTTNVARPKLGNVDRVHREVLDTINRMVSSPNERVVALGEQAQKVSEISHLMSAADSKRFTAKMLGAEKLSEVRSTIDFMAEKYADDMQRAATATTVEPFTKQMADKRAREEEAAMDRALGGSESQWKGSELKKPDATVKQALDGGKVGPKPVGPMGEEAPGTMYSRMGTTKEGYPRIEQPEKEWRSSVGEKVGPLEHAEIHSHMDADGDVSTYVFDSDNLGEGATLVMFLFKNDAGKWEIGMDGPQEGTGAFDRHRANFDTVSMKDADVYGEGAGDDPDAVAYSKFKPGAFSNSVMRKLMRTMRDHAADFGVRPDSVTWGRDTGNSAGKPYTEMSQAAFEAFSKQKVGPNRLTPDQMKDTAAHIESVLPGADTLFAGMLHAGTYNRAKDMTTGKAKDFIRLSVHSLDSMGTAFHESLHGFIQHMREADLHGVNKALYAAADSTVMIGKLEKLLANEPGALAQIERNAKNSTEERAAYMYQFYHTRDPVTGKRLLELNDAPRNVIEKIADFVKKTLGIWTANERAENIMNYFNSGEYARDGMGDRNAVSRVLLEQGTNKTFETIKQHLAPIGRIAHKIVSGGTAVVKAMKNPALDRISDLIDPTTTGEGKDVGFISAARTERTQVLNNLMTELGKMNATGRHIREAMEQLQSGVKAASPEARLLAREGGPVRKMLDGMKDYMEEAGVVVDDMGYKDGYFPVVWDVSYIASNQKAFRTMLDKYVRSGELKGSPDVLIQRLMANDGNEFGIETDRPGMQHLKERKLDFISPADRAQFLQKNMLHTLSSYVTQATRRAEWSRRFGDDSALLHAMQDEAVKKHGATTADMQTVGTFLRGVDGTLGDDIDPSLRRLFGNAIVYQNIRLLPMAVFSMAVDPGGIMVRGGTIKDSFNAFKRGIVEVKRGFDKNPGKDEWYELSEMMGTIDNSTLVHTMGSSYSQGMVGDTGRKVNDVFFKYNLVEQMNTSMRVAAMPAALGFMGKHADGTNSVHSKRWLAELNLVPGDVVMGKINGKDRPLLTQQEFITHGMNDTDALAASLKMRGAVNKWVDGAILRPNAAQKPGWMNDPHFALVAHLKQFVYSFNETIIKRVINEAKHGNYTPAYALASYVPTMMAADFIKGMVIGGGSQPGYKDDWDAADYVGNGVQRAGLFSTAQFGIDAWKSSESGGSAIGTLAGPMIEQLADSIGGHQTGSSFLKDAAPASTIVKAITRGESKADPVTTE